MGLFNKKKKNVNPLVDKRLAELTEAQRREYIERLEGERDDVIFELEEIMKTASKLMRRRSLAKRKFKLGRAPNDRRA